MLYASKCVLCPTWCTHAVGTCFPQEQKGILLDQSLVFISADHNYSYQLRDWVRTVLQAVQEGFAFVGAAQVAAQVEHRIVVA